MERNGEGGEMTKKEVKKISIHQGGKVMAILYFIVSAIVFIPSGFYFLFRLEPGEAVIMFIMPFVHSVLAYLFVALISWLYNLIAKSFGGIEITLDNSDHSTLSTK